MNVLIFCPRYASKKFSTNHTLQISFKLDRNLLEQQGRDYPENLTFPTFSENQETVCPTVVSALEWKTEDETEPPGGECPLYYGEAALSAV